MGESVEGRKLPRGFYERATLEVAREIVGKILVRRLRRSLLAGRIVEVEAYRQEGDLASHSARGKTKRNEVMFGPGGFLYVYFTYGMHFCMNVVTEQEGAGCALLIRALEPMAGVGEMRKRRGEAIPLHALTNGPAKCCEAFGVARAENGLDLAGEEMYILDAAPLPRNRLGRSRRIGIRRSTELPWRFFEMGNPFLSRRNIG